MSDFFYKWKELIVLLLILLALFIFYSLDILGEKKNPAGVWDKQTKNIITLKDVQAMDEAKEQVQDVIDFLKNPSKYKKLGAKLPKGALLIGPPGTGKTLLAKAIAGESGVTFYYMSGSAFEEVYVGVGPRRVRNLFTEARKNSPCIIFIDEIDAIAGKRRLHSSGSDSVSTLNELLAQMDGFTTNNAIFVIGSTNRPDVLDPAIMRPGRLGRKIYTNFPTLNERKITFKYYMGKIPSLNHAVSAAELADQTTGFSYADIQDICNEAVLVAARENARQVGTEHFNEAVDVKIGGIIKKEKILKGKEKKIVAYHEAGHSIVSRHLSKTTLPMVRVTIIPRTGGPLGFAQYKHSEKSLVQQDQILDRACVLYGGRAAENLLFGQPSTGAQNDLERIRKILYNFVAGEGMSKKIGALSFHNPQEGSADRYYYSQKLAEKIDEEVHRLSNECYQKAFDILTKHKKELIIVGEELLKKEVLSRQEFEDLLSKSAPTPMAAVDDVQQAPLPSAKSTPAATPGTDKQRSEDSPKLPIEQPT